ncbi:MAG: BON domain-containing protein [Pseudomonadota bacterium]
MKIKKVCLLLIILFISACSSVRNVIDWVPGVDSNEEIATQQALEAKQQRQQEREVYNSKAAYSPTGSLSEIDAEISVLLSQRYQQQQVINPSEIGIEVHSSVVSLSGSIKNEQTAIDLISIAKEIPGVTRVISHLIIISVRP